MSSSGPVRVRFAPSPTGFLHVGSARTALFNWLFARHVGGTYLLRIEDTDEERNRKDWSDGIVTTLDWLGIPPDEPPVYQSSRVEEHHAAADVLWDAGYLYACDCSREQVTERTAENKIPGYDGYCRDRNVSREQNALRFRVPESGTTVVHDLIHGDVEFPLSAIEDFVVVKSNGGPLFALANVVDDREMGITHVIRGDDLLPTTPKTQLLWEAFNQIDEESVIPLPEYAHLPMLVDEHRKKISKRGQSVSVEDYRAAGYLADGFANYLALLGWGHPEGVEVFDIDDVVQFFELANVHNAPAFFDVAKLRHVNGEHLRALDTGKFIALATPWLKAEEAVLDGSVLEGPIFQGGHRWPTEHFDPQVFQRIAPFVQERVATLAEVPPMIDFLFLDQPMMVAEDWDSIARDDAAKSILDAAITAYESCQFEPEALHAATNSVAESVGKKLAKAQAPIRVAITGKRVGPPLFESMALLGREKVLQRLRHARSRLDAP
ncbi:MAG: glutamate--tRNA ligase [Acidimicrobiales bacterium]